MGKIDDMRRLREAQYAERERGTQRRATSSVGEAPADAAADATDAEPAPARSASRRGASADEGACSACGKVKPVQNGVIAAHQKGLGKMCPGSRKAPR